MVVVVVAVVVVVVVVVVGRATMRGRVGVGAVVAGRLGGVGGAQRAI